VADGEIHPQEECSAEEEKGMDVAFDVSPPHKYAMMQFTTRSWPLNMSPITNTNGVFVVVVVVSPADSVDIPAAGGAGDIPWLSGVGKRGGCNGLPAVDDDNNNNNDNDDDNVMRARTTTKMTIHLCVRSQGQAGIG